MQLTPENLRVAGTILAKAAAHDNRVGGNQQERVLARAAWCEALDPGTTIEDGTRAVTEHYRHSTEYLTVAHINKITRRYRTATSMAGLHYSQVTPPESLADDPAAQTTWVAAWWQTWVATGERQAADWDAWQAVGGRPPEQIGDADLAQIKQQLTKFRKKGS